MSDENDVPVRGELGISSLNLGLSEQQCSIPLSLQHDKKAFAEHQISADLFKSEEPLSLKEASDSNAAKG